MSALQPLESLRPPVRIDQRVILHGVRWQDDEALLAIRGSTRMSYLDGGLELMSPSFDHDDKLEVYRGLGVPEAWFGQGGALSNYLLAGDAYHQAHRNRLLPGLDPDLILRFMSYPSQTQAVRGLR